MALSPEKIALAKEEAQDFLEYSIYVLSLTLMVDLETANSSMEIPVAADDPDYTNYVSLKRQLAALEALTP